MTELCNLKREWALDAKKVLSLLTVSSLVVFGVLISFTLQANAIPPEEKGRTTSLEALGVLQVAAHDLYHFDRCGDDVTCAIENEDGKLNLSTLLEIKTAGCIAFDTCVAFSDGEISDGGEARNSDSILIFTVASELGEKYLELRAKHGEDIAYDKILEIYHKKVKIAFQQTFNQPFPTRQPGSLDNNHNLALRSGHDFLPGMVKFNGEQVSVFDPILFGGAKFSKSELKQRSSPLDGQFDDFWNRCIAFGFPPSCTMDPDAIPLLFLDQTFGIIFTDFVFDDFMDQTSDGRYDSDEDVTKLLIEQFAIGMNLP